MSDISKKCHVCKMLKKKCICLLFKLKKIKTIINKVYEIKRARKWVTGIESTHSNIVQFCKTLKIDLGMGGFIEKKIIFVQGRQKIRVLKYFKMHKNLYGFNSF